MTDFKRPVRFRGIGFEYGDDVLIVPPITCDQAVTLADEIDLATSTAGLKRVEEIMALDAEGFRAHSSDIRCRRASMKKVVAVALRRNYPGITDEEISDFISQENIQSSFHAAMALSGDTKKIKNPGEFQASGDGANPSTGQTPAPGSLPA